MASAPSRLVTPEAVLLDVRPAGPGTRLAARALDLLVVAAVLVVGGIALAAAATAAGGGVALVITYLVLAFAAVFAYPAVMEATWRGRTLGKAAFGLRVVTTQGAPVTFRHAAIRSALWIVDGLVLGPVIGTLCILLTRDTVRVGDLVAGTIVVRERASGAVAPVEFRPPPGLEGYVATLDVSGLGVDGYGLVRSFLVRAAGFDPAVRERLALTVATRVAARLRVGPQPVAPETFLWSVAAAVQAAAPPPAPAPAPPAAWSWGAPPGGGPVAPPQAWPSPPQAWPSPPQAWPSPPPWSPPPGVPAPADPTWEAPA